MIKEYFRDSALFGPYYLYVRKRVVGYIVRRRGMRCLSEITKALNNYGIVSFADFGTLLGVIRDKQIIRNDLDIDIGVIAATEDIYDKVVDVFNNQGYRKTREFEINGEVKEQSFVKGLVKIDIQYYYQDQPSDSMYCYLFYHPKTIADTERWQGVRKVCPIVKEVKVARVRGFEIYIPDNAEELLIAKYGEKWRIPDKGWVYWEGPNTLLTEEEGVLKTIDRRDKNESINT